MVKPAQGPAVIADKLSYFIRTGQMVRLLQGEGHRIDYVQLARFSPLPGMPAPGGATAASESAGSHTLHAVIYGRQVKTWKCLCANAAHV